MPENTDRFDRIEANLDRLTTVVGALAATVTAHDDQIENLIRVSEIQKERMDAVIHQWQAYLNTIHPRQ